MKELYFDVRMISMNGIGAYIRNLLIYLKKGPFKLRLVVNREHLSEWPWLEKFDLVIAKSKIYSFQEQIELPLIVSKTDLFWSPHFNIPLGYIRAKKRIVTIHDVCYLVFSHTLSFAKKIYAKTVISQATSRSDLIFTGSSFSKEEVKKFTGVKDHKIVVIPYGLNHTIFHAQKDDRVLKKIQSKYNLPEKFFLYVGSIANHKNVRCLLKAFQKLEKNFSDWKFIFVGGIKYQKSDFKKFMDCYPVLKDRILFLGFVEELDLPMIYQSAYALIHPSLYEGFGFTPIEAMGCGCPTLVSSVASLPEVCGENTLYINPYDEEDIASGMRKVILDKCFRAALVKKGLERAKQFKWDETAKAHIECLQKLY